MSTRQRRRTVYSHAERSGASRVRAKAGGLRQVYHVTKRKTVVATVAGEIRPIGSPLSRLISKQIDQEEYLRQVNVQRERNGLPPMTLHGSAGQ